MIQEATVNGCIMITWHMFAGLRTLYCMLYESLPIWTEKTWITYYKRSGMHT